MIYIFVFWLIGLLVAAIFYKVKDGRILHGRYTYGDFFALLFFTSLAYWVIVPAIVTIIFLIIYTEVFGYALAFIGVIAVICGIIYFPTKKK